MLSSLKASAKKIISSGYLPCSILMREPMILVAYDSDFVKNKDSFLQALRGYEKVYLFLQLGWQCQTPSLSERFAQALHDIMKECPALSVTVLANEPAELEKLSELGINVMFCNQNAFIDENKFTIINTQKKYDAIYIARITPFKRHHLATKISSLRMIGDYFDTEKAYVDTVFESLPNASYERKVSMSGIPGEIAQARCGLCLSAEEGAMFVSAEYLLCGIPIVNTKNIGGRDIMFPDFAVKNVNDTPEAVAEAVAGYKESTPAPEKIRSAILEKMYIHRQKFIDALNDILKKHEKPPFHGKLPHKLALRCTRMPWDNWKYGLKVGK